MDLKPCPFCGGESTVEDEYKPIFGMCFECKKNDSGFSGGFEENFDCPYQDEENGTCWEAYK